MRQSVKCLAVLFCVVWHHAVSAQTCTTLGQTPSTAFPVCGVNVFEQETVPICGGRIIPGPCNGVGATLQDLNPFWYKFTCFESGTLGFLIEPYDQGDDYDWQLFDITGHNPEDVYTDASLFVACNWSGSTGNTGASSSGSGFENCAGGYPIFSSMPAVLQGHQYLLLLSHFTVFNPGQEGYKLSFQGGTASITDPTVPGLLNAAAACDGSTIRLKLNKKIKCTSIDPDGSDFRMDGNVANVIAATGIGCSSGFDVDSIAITLDRGLTPGDYKVVVKTGSTGLLLDNCDNGIDTGSMVDVVVYPVVPTPFNTMLPVACAPGYIDVVFNRGIRCNSIAANGSDFRLTGPYPVGIVSAEGFCSDNLTTTIRVHLAAKLQTGGTFSLELLRGTDSNSIIDECGSETPEHAVITFSVQDTVSAEFTYNITENCTNDYIELHNDGRININYWDWTIEAEKSTLQHPALTFVTYGNKTVQLAVTNGFCSDTVSKVIYFPHDTLTAMFNGPSLYCPNDIAIFKDSSRSSASSIAEWHWAFGNGRFSTLQMPPPQTYYTSRQEEIVEVSLAVKNGKGCFDTATGNITVTRSCYIAVPSAFTPNGDGNNDYLYPLYAYKATDLYFSVYNRMGQRVYETRDWTKKWNGTINGNPQPTGVYVWMLRYKDETGKTVFLKGTTVLMR